MSCVLHEIHVRLTCSSNLNYMSVTCALHVTATPEIAPEDLTFRAVMHQPRKYLQPFVTYWCDDERSTCTEGVVLTIETLRKTGWQKAGAAKNVAKLAAHRFLPGLCRTHANKSFDFCISQNLLPVIYAPNDEEVEEEIDMVKVFCSAFWCCYCNLATDEAPIDSDECQMVTIPCDSHATYMLITCNLHVNCMQHACDSFTAIYY